VEPCPSRLAALQAENARLRRIVQADQAAREDALQLAAVSHDLRQPAHAIALHLDGLGALDLPDRARQAINDARACASDLGDMLRSLLDLSQLQARRPVAQPAAFAIQPVLQRLQREFAPLAALHGVRLKILPSAAQVHSDLAMVERIAMNFVSNAVRHTPGGRVLVTCRARSQGRVLRLAVHDNGPGIAPAQQQAIFDAFYRTGNAPAPDRSGGAGLGLAIVRRLAQALDAPVTVRSSPCRGAVFAVDLPLVAPSLAGAAVENPVTPDGRLAAMTSPHPADEFHRITDEE